MVMKGWPCHSPKSVTEATKGWQIAGGDARLVEEHLDELALAGQVRMDALDGHQAAEAVGPVEAAEVHGGHAPVGDLGTETIGAEPSRPYQTAGSTGAEPALQLQHRRRPRLVAPHVVTVRIVIVGPDLSLYILRIGTYVEQSHIVAHPRPGTDGESAPEAEESDPCIES